MIKQSLKETPLPSGEHCRCPYLITLIHQDKEEVKAGHDGRRHVDVLLQGLCAVVSAVDRVGGSQDRCSGI